MNIDILGFEIKEYEFVVFREEHYNLITSYLDSNYIGYSFFWLQNLIIFLKRRKIVELLLYVQYIIY